MTLAGTAKLGNISIYLESASNDEKAILQRASVPGSFVGVVGVSDAIVLDAEASVEHSESKCFLVKVKIEFINQLTRF